MLYGNANCLAPKTVLGVAKVANLSYFMYLSSFEKAKIEEELTELNTNKFNYEIINQSKEGKERHFVKITINE